MCRQWWGQAVQQHQAEEEMWWWEATMRCCDANARRRSWVRMMLGVVAVEWWVMQRSNRTWEMMQDHHADSTSWAGEDGCQHTKYAKEQEAAQAGARRMLSNILMVQWDKRQCKNKMISCISCCWQSGKIQKQETEILAVTNASIVGLHCWRWWSALLVCIIIVLVGGPHSTLVTRT